MGSPRASTRAVRREACSSISACRRSSSSPMASSSRASTISLNSRTAMACCRSASWPSAAWHDSASLAWRSWSSARRLAAVISQAPGRSGTPSSGQCSSAASSTSCAQSSARLRSCVMRAACATTLADSMRQMAAMACLVASVPERSDLRMDHLCSFATRRVWRPRKCDDGLDRAPPPARLLCRQLAGQDPADVTRQISQTQASAVFQWRGHG